MLLRPLCMLFVAALALGCTPKIGKSCTLSTDCSQLGDRFCDSTQPGGYCTIFNCEPDQCPDSICIAFDPTLDPACGAVDNGRWPRFQRSFCMAPCDSDSDCRDQYECVDLSIVANQVSRSAEVVDLGAQDGGLGSKVCMASTCGDGIKDGAETGIDCGGPDCKTCNNGDGCGSGTDCTSGACANGICVGPTCTDGKQDGAEQDVDCGGPDCARCATGKKCAMDSDCISNSCSPMTGLCTGDCRNDVKDGAETDVDCGGPVCPLCPNTKSCNTGADCSSGFCQPVSSAVDGGASVAGVCTIPPLCFAPDAGAESLPPPYVRDGGL